MKRKSNFMSLFLVLFLISLLAVGIIAGCSGGSDNGGGGGEASLIGTVRNESTGTVIANATVSIDQTTTTTGTDGTYSLINLSTGTYTFTVSMTGYLTYQASVTLIEGSNTKNASLTPEITPTATVSGIVSVNDAVLDGVTVSLTGIGNDITDVQGAYGFINVPYGTYTVTAAKTGYNGYTGQVTVNSASVTHNIAMTYSNDLPAPEEGKAHITGYVVDEYGEPMKDVKCTLYNLSGKKGERLIIVYTDANGRYIYLNVNPGNYQILFQLLGYIIPSTTIIVENGDVGEPPPAPGEPDDPPVDPPNPSTTILRGTVTGPLPLKLNGKAVAEPIPDVLIILGGGEGKNQLNGGGLETFTNGQGVYQFNNPPTGNQLIRALKDGYNEYNNNVEVIQNQTTIHDIEINMEN